jgi:hypothetical protein
MCFSFVDVLVVGYVLGGFGLVSVRDTHRRPQGRFDLNENGRTPR